MKRSLTILTLASLILCAAVAYAGDSPQFRGPHRDGRFDETGLMKAWPESGPPAVFTAHGLGKGYSSVSVVKGKIYTTGMFDNDMGHFLILDTQGAIERNIPYGPETTNNQAPGPRSTPTMDDNRAYLVSGLGVLYCLDSATGKKLWEADLLGRFDAKNNMWNLAESVLVDGNRVICTPGGTDAVFVALDKMTGETLWTTKGLNDRSSYCSPIIVTHNNRRILVGETGAFIAGADAETGALLWSFHQKVPWDIHANTPLFEKGLIYYTAGDARGGGALELSEDGSAVTSKWESTVLDPLHNGVVLVDGYLYAAGSKQAQLGCLEMATGKTMWTTKEIKEAVIIHADGMLYLYESPKSGVVKLVKASPAGYECTGQFTVTEGDGNHWTHPVIANGILYIRHGDALCAYDVRAK